MTDPNPERFQQFILLTDGSGFKLPDGTIFKFDEFGGWYDEHKNYYNSAGIPSEPKKPKIKEPQECKTNEEAPSSRFLHYKILEDKSGFQLMDGSTFYFDKQGGWFDEENNYYNSAGVKCTAINQQKSFNDEQKNLKNKAFNSIQQQIHQNQQAEKLQKEKKNKNTQKINKDLIDQIINYYQKNDLSSELQFYFKYDNFIVKGREIIEFLTRDLPETEIKNFFFNYEQANKRKKKGTGQFICSNKMSAMHCAQCHNQNSLFQISLEQFDEQDQPKMFQGNNNESENNSFLNKHLFE